MKILLVNYRYFISGGPEKYMFNIKKMLEDNGHEVIPFSIHSNKNVETEYSKYFVEPIGSRDATYFEECKKTPKVIWQMLTRSIYSTEVEKAIKKEIKDVKPDLVYIIHFVNKLSPSVICGAKKMGVPVVLRLSDYFLLCPRFDFMYNKKPCEECLTKGYRTCIKKRCVKGSLFASVVRVFSMKVHKAMNVYKGVDAFITPSEFLKKKLIEQEVERVSHVIVGANKKTQEFMAEHESVSLNTGMTLTELIRRPELDYDMLAPLDPERPNLHPEVREQVNINIKYDGYITRQIKQVEEFKRLENKKLTPDLNYELISGLRIEARQKLNKLNPLSIGQASRIQGVSPADISVLLVYLGVK